MLNRKEPRDSGKSCITVTKYLEHLEKIDEEVFPISYPATCQELADQGETVDGKFSVKPTRGSEIFEVNCKFSNGNGTTIFYHGPPSFGLTSTPGQSNGSNF